MMLDRASLYQLFCSTFGVSAPFGSYQVEPAVHLLNGRNVILQAPTGSGKTLAALFPYFLARAQNINFPRKAIYCVPMRVLARSFWDDLQKRQSGIDARLQTGEQQGDRKLEGEITFATIDQLLSSFLNIPYSLSLRQGNINAGAVVSSYLIFDEFHLLDPGSTLPTTLEMLRMLKGVTPWILMTATFSRPMLSRLASLLEAEIIMVDEQELSGIPSQRNKVRRFHQVDSTLNAEAVFQHHRSHSIAICNTVERAQQLFMEIRSLADPDTRVFLLHSRFIKEHREAKEDLIRCLFRKDRQVSDSVILIATQVIEVGMDISCEAMHTEIAPASSILQRAGRCARFESENGDVYVYQVPYNQKGEPNYAPYLNQQALLCQKTWETLSRFDGENMDFLAEQNLINLVHAEADGRMLDGLEQSGYAHRQEMNKTISYQEIGRARQLIRNDDSVTVLVHPEPCTIDNPYGLEGFSLFPGSLHGQYQKWRERGLPNNEVPWLLMYPQERDGEEGEDRPIRYQWMSVKDQHEINRSTIHVVNPRLVQYDSEIGFRFTDGGEFESPLHRHHLQVAGKEERRGYRRETYHEHIQKMLAVYQSKLYPEIAHAASRLESQLHLPPGTLDRVVRLAIALHDVGKMDRRWQQWAHNWQAHIGVKMPDEYMLAHTDYDPDDPLHQNLEKGLPDTRPPHAAEGAVAVVKMLYRLLGEPSEAHPNFQLLKAVFSAICRHHSPRADSYQRFSLHPSAKAVLAEVLAGVGVDKGATESLVMSREPQPIASLLVQPESRYELLAYFLIVRALRLADQGALAMNQVPNSEKEG